jgi:ribosomal protein S8
MLSRIQNAIILRRHFVLVLRSKFCVEVLKLLYKEGLINGYSVSNGDANKLIVFLKYSENNCIFSKFKIFSKPGRRYYVKSRKILNFYARKGLFVVSTSRYGLLTSVDLFRNKFILNRTGGELLFQIIF